MKKMILLCLVLVLAALLCANFFANDLVVNVDGVDLDGAAGYLVAGLAGGFGLLVAAFVLLIVGAVLGFFFVGGTVLLVGGLALGAVLLALVAFPFCLPALLPVLLVWGIAKLLRKHKKPELPSLTH